MIYHFLYFPKSAPRSTAKPIDTFADSEVKAMAQVWYNIGGCVKGDPTTTIINKIAKAKEQYVVELDHDKMKALETQKSADAYRNKDNC